MKKRIVALILTLIMLIGTVPVFAEDAITVYMSISKYGEIVETKDGDAFAYLPVKLKGKDEYTIDDAFLAAHTEYYEDGENGYQTEESDWGLSICKLWGDTSYNFGYQVNGGAESVMGPTHILEGGEYIDATIYKNAYPDSESYSAFDTFKEEAFAECTALKKVYIPKTVTFKGSGQFLGAESLASITFENGTTKTSSVLNV